MSEPKYAHRFPPCPIYDVETMEGWLEDLAKQGLLLTKGGLFCGFLEFQKTAPKPMRYRMQPLPKKKFHENDRPHDAALELAEEYGWQYFCSIGDFAVYGCDNPNARELDTDPQVQAMMLAQHHRRKRNLHIRSTIVLLISVGLLVFCGPMTFFLESNRSFSITLTILLILYPFLTMGELRLLQRLKQKLKLGEPLSRNRNWRKGRWRHWLFSVLSLVLVVSMYGSLLFGRLISWEDRVRQSLTAFDGDIPFATIADFAGEGTFDPGGSSKDNHIAQRTTLLGNQIVLHQFGEVIQDDTVVLHGMLDVWYYDLHWEWAARAVFRELHRQNRFGKRYEAVSIPDLPTEQETAYTNSAPYLLLQDGNRFVRIRFIQFRQGNVYPLDYWASTAAEHFLQRSE